MIYDITEYFRNIDRLYCGGGVSKSIVYGISKKNKDYTTTIKNKCISLGWKKSFIERKLRYVYDELIDDYNENDCILGFSSIWLEQKRYTNSISKTYISIGIHKNIADTIETIVQPLQNSCYTNKQLLDLGIEYLIGKFTSLQSIHSKYSIYETNENIWMPHITKKNTIQIMNIDSTCKTIMDEHQLYRKLLSNIQKLIVNDKNRMLFYHTTNWKSFRYIRNVIRHTYSMKCLDFGFTSGFYVSKNLYDCIEWGYKKNSLFSNEVCIFIFSLPTTMPNYITYKHLQGNEWKDIVTISRQCAMDDLDDVTMDRMIEIDNYDFVYGNICNNPNDVVMKGRSPTFHIPLKQQLVSKTNIGDTYLQESMIGCIFFKKNSNI